MFLSNNALLLSDMVEQTWHKYQIGFNYRHGSIISVIKVLRSCFCVFI